MPKTAPKLETVTEFPIDKDFPIPLARNPGKTPKYPWLEMEVDDSFFVPRRSSDKFANQASRAGKRYGLKFAVRAVDDGCRVWRTA